MARMFSANSLTNRPHWGSGFSGTIAPPEIWEQMRRSLLYGVRMGRDQQEQSDVSVQWLLAPRGPGAGNDSPNKTRAAYA